MNLELTAPLSAVLNTYKAKGRSVPKAKKVVDAWHYPASKELESVAQKAILEYLQKCYRVAWARRINTGKFKVNDTHGTRWIQAGFVGCSDILGQLTDGRLLAIECKSATGRLSDEQAVFLDVVNNAGGVGFVARSVDDVVRVFRELKVL